MKTKSQLAQYAIRVLLILLPLLGVLTAIIIYKYETIVNGILGGTVIFLLFYYLKSSKTDLSLKNMAASPNVFNHALFVFIAPILSFWATGAVFDMISLILKELTKFLK